MVAKTIDFVATCILWAGSYVMQYERCQEDATVIHGGLYNRLFYVDEIFMTK